VTNEILRNIAKRKFVISVWHFAKFGRSDLQNAKLKKFIPRDSKKLKMTRSISGTRIAE
jgi:hypothetical protein